MATKAKTKRGEIWATAGITESEYGTQNPCLRLETDDGSPEFPERGRRLTAASYRAAAAIEERLDGVSACAVCVDARNGRIHLEFSERASQAEQDAARAVLDAVAGGLNRRAA